MRARTPLGGGLALGFSRGRGQAAPPPAGVPANTGVPAISGSPAVDETLSASTGSWSNSPTSFAYQWYADAVAIPGATGSTYLLTASEEGANITVGVVATNIVGDSTEAVSAAVGPVTASFAITTPVVSTAAARVMSGDGMPTMAHKHEAMGAKFIDWQGVDGFTVLPPPLMEDVAKL